MARRLPWHSLLQNVHHVRTECSSAQRAELEVGSRREGDGGRPLCPECAAIDAHDPTNDAPG